MEAQRDRHFCDNDSHTGICEWCDHRWPCPDRVAADDTLTELNNTVNYQSFTGEITQYKLIPDPDSQGAA